ncbi:MAG: sulfotransferase [Cyanobacteria bacterium J06643_4]
MTLSNTIRYQLGLIGFARVTTILRLARHAPYVHPRYVWRFLIVALSSFVVLPFALCERMLYGRKIAKTQLQQPPIFIIGHWRSGTTYLHNLMSQDDSFGYLSMYQALMPDCSLIGRYGFKSLVTKILPLKRPMDNVTWPMDSPQEEEIALAKIMPDNFYNHFLFPNKSIEFFRKHVLFEESSPRKTAEFNRKYDYLLKVATVHAQGKPLILKNPVNTARVSKLLELFPEAKFIHIHRSPYDVFKSLQNFRKTLMPLIALHPIDPERSEEASFELYESMMQQYFQDRSQIPAGNLVEVRYETLEQDPLGELQRIYKGLDLPGFDTAQIAFRQYIDAQKSYQKNKLELSPTAQRKIEDRWKFAFSSLGYALNSQS